MLLESRLSVEKRLILALAVATPDFSLSQKNRISAYLREPIQWDRFFDYARHFGVDSLLAYNILLIREVFPEPIIQACRNTLLRYAPVNLLALRTCRQINEDFRAHNIPLINFKGPSLAVRGYLDSIQRKYSDLDIVIPKQYVPAAVQRLTMLGYTRLTEADHPIWGKEVFDLEHGYHLAFRHTQHPFGIELHWQMTNRDYEFDIPEEILLSNVRSLDLGGVSISTFNDELLIVLLCIHGSKHKWKSLKWICDVGYILAGANDISWDTLIAMAQEFKVMRRVLLGLYLASELFDIALPSSVSDLIDRYPIVSRMSKLGFLWLFSTTDEDSLTIESYRYHIMEHDTKTQQLRYSLEIMPQLFLQFVRVTQKDRDFVKLPKGFSFLYIFIRPIRWAYHQLLRNNI